jgi:hypothetical protein
MRNGGLGQKSGLILVGRLPLKIAFKQRGEQSDSPISINRICAPGIWVSRAAVQAGLGGHIEAYPMDRQNAVNFYFSSLLNYFAVGDSR